MNTRTRHRLHPLVLAVFLAACGSTPRDPVTPPEPPAPDVVEVQGCIEGTFAPYRGVLHAHTGYSDGELTPAEAFAYGRDQGGLDILLITDHLEMLYLWFPEEEKWEKCRQQADAAYEPGRFLADCGYEYGSGASSLIPWVSTGHNNVFFHDSLMPIIQLDFHDFFRSLVQCSSCVGQFNHPGSNEGEHWNHFEYFPDVDEKMNLFEFNSDPAWELFFQALDAGWHVSPTYNQDNHSADWGTRDERRSGLFLTELTREALHDAMRNRRSFMSEDKNAFIQMTAYEKCWMGSILTGEMPEWISVQVEARDPDPGDGWAVLEIFGPGMELLRSFDCGGRETCSAAFTFDTGAATYFVARAVQADGHRLVAAPLWIDPE